MLVLIGQNIGAYETINRLLDYSEPRRSFSEFYEQCTSSLLDENLALQAQIGFTQRNEIEKNPYLQPKLDLWLLPWSSQSSVVGYLPQKNSDLAAWVRGWPLLRRKAFGFSDFQACSNNQQLRHVWDGVYAVKRGVVISKEIDKGGDYGNYILIQHDGEPDSPVTLYAHLKSIELELGQRVGEGQRIGKMGASGRGAAGRVHLHFSYFLSIERILDENGEIKPSSLYRYAQNPVYFIAEGAYPTNTHIGNYHSSRYEPSFFNQLYPRFRRYHEGIDFSGRSWELIEGWQQGFVGSPIIRQYHSRADKERNPWLYELDRR